LLENTGFPRYHLEELFIVNEEWSSDNGDGV